jgi:hypothetical protein
VSANKVSAWLLVVLLVAVGAFSWRTPTVFGLYVGLLIPGVVFHWYYACRRCTNLACALNAASDAFFLGGRVRSLPADTPEYSDINSAVAAWPLVLALGVGLYGAYLASVWALLGLLAVLAAAGVTYVPSTCARCTNDCPLNGNDAYREWKGPRKSGASPP